MSEQSTAELNELANKRFEAGDFHGCIHWAEQAEVRARQTDENCQELWAIGVQVEAWANLGEEKMGLEAATRLMDRARKYGQEDYLLSGTRLFANRAAAIDLRNRWREIRSILIEGLETARRLGSRNEEVEHLRRLGEFAWQVGEEKQGFAWLQEALNILEQGTDYDSFFRYVLNAALSGLMRKRGNHTEALRYAEIALEAAQEDGNPNFVADAQLTLARVERARGELDQALQLADGILPQARQMRWNETERQAEYLRGELLCELGYPESAEMAAQRALELAQDLQLKEEEVECLLSCGQALLALARKEEARNALKQARRLSQERDYADHFEKAEELLVKCD